MIRGWRGRARGRGAWSSCQVVMGEPVFVASDGAAWKGLERGLGFLPGASGGPPGEGLTLGFEKPVSVASEGGGPGVLAR